MIEILLGTKPKLYLAIAGAFVTLYLIWNHVLAPIIEAVCDLAERSQTRALYERRETAARRRLDAAVGLPRRHQ